MSKIFVHVTKIKNAMGFEQNITSLTHVVGSKKRKNIKKDDIVRKGDTARVTLRGDKYGKVGKIVKVVGDYYKFDFDAPDEDMWPYWVIEKVKGQKNNGMRESTTDIVPQMKSKKRVDDPGYDRDLKNGNTVVYTCDKCGEDLAVFPGQENKPCPYCGGKMVKNSGFTKDLAIAERRGASADKKNVATGQLDEYRKTKAEKIQRMLDEARKTSDGREQETRVREIMVIAKDLGVEKMVNTNQNAVKGPKDKNGKPLHRGDVVYAPSNFGGMEKGEVAGLGANDPGYSSSAGPQISVYDKNGCIFIVPASYCRLANADRPKPTDPTFDNPKQKNKDYEDAKWKIGQTVAIDAVGTKGKIKSITQRPHDYYYKVETKEGRREMLCELWLRHHNNAQKNASVSKGDVVTVNGKRGKVVDMDIFGSAVSVGVSYEDGSSGWVPEARVTLIKHKESVIGKFTNTEKKMNPGKVDEALWSKAKEAAKKSGGGWALVSTIYQKMGGKFHKKES